MHTPQDMLSHFNNSTYMYYVHTTSTNRHIDSVSVPPVYSLAIVLLLLLFNYLLLLSYSYLYFFFNCIVG